MTTLLSLSIIITVLLIIFYKIQSFGLATVIFLLPFERIGSFSISQGTIVRPVQLAVIAFVGSTFLQLITKKITWRYVPALYWLLGLAAINLIPLLTLNYFPLWRDYASFWLLILFYIALSQINIQKNLKLIISSITVSAGLIILFGFWQFIGDIAGISNGLTSLIIGYSKLTYGFSRIHSTLAEPLFYANYLLLPFFVFLSIATTSNNTRTSILYSCGVIASTISLLLTTSRGGLLATLIGLIFFLYFVLYNKRFINSALKQIGILVITITVGVLLLISASIKNSGGTAGLSRFIKESSSKLFNTASYNERLSAADTALRFIKEKPWFGHGVGGFTYRLAEYPKSGESLTRIAVNNQYIETLFETGIIGLFFYTGFLITLLAGTVKALFRNNITRNYLLLALVPVLIGILVQLTTFSGFFITYHWTVLGLLAAAISPGTQTKLP